MSVVRTPRKKNSWLHLVQTNPIPVNLLSFRFVLTLFIFKAPNYVLAQVAPFFLCAIHELLEEPQIRRMGRGRPPWMLMVRRKECSSHHQCKLCKCLDESASAPACPCLYVLCCLCALFVSCLLGRAWLCYQLWRQQRLSHRASSAPCTNLLKRHNTCSSAAAAIQQFPRYS